MWSRGFKLEEELDQSRNPSVTVSEAFEANANWMASGVPSSARCGWGHTVLGAALTPLLHCSSIRVSAIHNR